MCPPARPNGRLPEFDGYELQSEIPSGGSGARLFVARPIAAKRSELARRAAPAPEQVVIKSFHRLGPELVRELEGLRDATELGLVVDRAGDADLAAGSRYWYAMPYLPGRDLRVVLDSLHRARGEGGLEERDLRLGLDVLCGVLGDLQRFHERGLWHKDVKPANVVLGEHGARLVDLGLLSRRDAAQLTLSGTPSYMDPELERQARQGLGTRLDPATYDLYGVGAMLFHLLEGRAPQRGEVLRPKRCRSLALNWVVQRATTASVQDRYPSALPFRQDLEALRDAVDPSTVRPVDLPSQGGSPPLLPEARRVRGAGEGDFPRFDDERSWTPLRSRRGPRPVAVAGVLLLLLLVAGVGWLATRADARLWLRGTWDALAGTSATHASPAIVARRATRWPLPTREQVQADLRALPDTRRPAFSSAQLRGPLRVYWIPSRPDLVGDDLRQLAAELGAPGQWEVQGEGIRDDARDAELLTRARHLTAGFPHAVAQVNDDLRELLREEGYLALIWYDVPAAGGQPHVIPVTELSGQVGIDLSRALYETLAAR